MTILKLVVSTALLTLALITTGRADLLWGANGHPFTAYPGITIQRQLDYLKD